MGVSGRNAGRGEEVDEEAALEALEGSEQSGAGPTVSRVPGGSSLGAGV